MKLNLLYDSVVLGIKRNENLGSHESLYTNVYSGLIIIAKIGKA